jgi:hypothetical protein
VSARKDRLTPNVAVKIRVAKIMIQHFIDGSRRSLDRAQVIHGAVCQLALILRLHHDLLRRCRAAILRGHRERLWPRSRCTAKGTALVSTSSRRRCYIGTGQRSLRCRQSWVRHPRSVPSVPQRRPILNHDVELRAAHPDPLSLSCRLLETEVVLGDCMRRMVPGPRSTLRDRVAKLFLGTAQRGRSSWKWFSADRGTTHSSSVELLEVHESWSFSHDCNKDSDEMAPVRQDLCTLRILYSFLAVCTAIALKA